MKKGEKLEVLCYEGGYYFDKTKLKKKVIDSIMSCIKTNKQQSPNLTNMKPERKRIQNMKIK